LFSIAAHYSARLFRRDLIGGMARLIRRSRGTYRDVLADNVEYHIVRDGVDQDLIRERFEANGFRCQIIPCFSTASGFWQRIGDHVGFINTFAVVAKRDSGAMPSSNGAR